MRLFGRGEQREPGTRVVLVGEVEPELLAGLATQLAADGLELATAAGAPEQALAALRDDDRVVILALPASAAVEALRRLERRQPAILLVRDPSVPTGVAAMRLGAWDYLTLPCELDRLARTVREAAARVRNA